MASICLGLNELKNEIVLAVLATDQSVLDSTYVLTGFFSACFDSTCYESFISSK